MDMILDHLKGSNSFLEVSVKTVYQYADDSFLFMSYHFLKIKIN